MKRIILVGFMGVGKTTLGKKVAKKLGVDFIDSDHEIETHYNKSIGEIFSELGESSFREMEADYIKALDLRDNFVLATGGGMPCFNNNMGLLNQIGTTVYLERSAKELAHRLSHSKTSRPLIEGLTESELLEFIEAKLLQREVYYKQADFILNRNEQTADLLIQCLSGEFLPLHQKS